MRGIAGSGVASVSSERPRSVSLTELALVPAAQREPRGQRGEQGQHYTGRGDEKQSGKQPRDVELQPGKKNRVREPGGGTAGPGDEFGDDRADQRQARGDAQAREKIRERARYAQPYQRLPASGSIHAKELREPRIDAAQSQRGIGDD